MRGGKAKTRRSKTQKSARTSAMGSLMSPVDVTSTSMLSDLDKRIKSGPLTLVLVYADWCGHCNRFKPMMKQLENLNNRSIQMARVRDDIYPKTPLALKNKVEGYPSLLLVDSAGNAMNFKQPSGEVTNSVPDHTNMSKMTALVRTAGTPEGMNLLNSVNKNLTGKPLTLPSGTAEANRTIASLPTVNTNSALSLNSGNNHNNNHKNNRNTNMNRNTNSNSAMDFDSAAEASVETVPLPSVNAVATEQSLMPNSAPQNIVADRLSNTNILTQNSTMANSSNKTVQSLTQSGGSMASENFCGSSCTIPHSQSGGSCQACTRTMHGGGLLGALSAAATNLAPAAALFLAADRLKRGRKGSRKQRGGKQRGGCGCGLTRRNARN